MIDAALLTRVRTRGWVVPPFSVGNAKVPEGRFGPGNTP